MTGGKLRSRVSRIIEVADWMEKDISDRGLAPGSRYLGAHAAAKMLKIGARTLYRKLSAYAEQEEHDE